MDEDAGLGDELDMEGENIAKNDDDNDDDDDEDKEFTVAAASEAKDPDSKMALTYGITVEQLNKLREGFKLFANGTTDFIMSSNFGNALRACGQIPTEAELASLLKDAEASDRGLLNFEDFVRLAARWGLKADMEMERELEVAMSTLDKEGTGYVDATRFKEMMKNLGEPIPDDEIKEILKLCDVRPDGKFAIFSLMKKLMSK